MPEQAPIAGGTPEILFVDLDGTLLKTDLLYESLLLLLRHQPLSLVKLPVWLLKGRAIFKHRVASLVSPDATRLPYRDDVVKFVREQKATGRQIVLATASERRWAEQVAEEVGMFDAVLATSEANNLRGAAKLMAIEDYCRDNEFSSFAYVGDHQVDLPIWENAAEIHVVAPSRTLLEDLRRVGEPASIIEDRSGLLRPLLRALRPQQWVKNLLLFAPVALAHAFDEVAIILAAALAFGVFCTCASAIYLFNDLLDVEADRGHPQKRSRPFASGALPIQLGAPAAIGLIAIAFAIAALSLPAAFTATAVLYLVATTLYSLWLKRFVMVDVLVLAGLYTIRILAGGFATGIAVSEWLMAFAVFLFTSLAFAKRYAEVSRLESEGKDQADGRGYLASDLSLIETMGPVSGYLAVLVFALYINSEAVTELYGKPWPLWLICPLLLYWISRIWFLAKRGQLSEDPVVFAIRDRVSILVGLLVVLCVGAATIFNGQVLTVTQ